MLLDLQVILKFYRENSRKHYGKYSIWSIINQITRKSSTNNNVSCQNNEAETSYKIHNIQSEAHRISQNCYAKKDDFYLLQYNCNHPTRRPRVRDTGFPRKCKVLRLILCERTRVRNFIAHTHNFTTEWHDLVAIPYIDDAGH